VSFWPHKKASLFRREGGSPSKKKKKKSGERPFCDNRHLDVLSAATHRSVATSNNFGTQRSGVRHFFVVGVRTFRLRLDLEGKYWVFTQSDRYK
jgi:hypothetical protein